MKKIVISTLILALAGWRLAPEAAAQAKIATLNLQKVFEEYWRCRQDKAELNKQIDGFNQQLKEMLASYQQGNKEFKALLDGSNDAASSAEARAKQKLAADTKLGEIQKLENAYVQKDRDARTNIVDQQRQLRENRLREIQEVVAAKAKAAGYALVVDVAAHSTDTPNALIVLYCTKENEITEEILGQLNKGAPAEFLKTAEKK